MPCQILIFAGTTHRKQTKGEMFAVRDEPTEWGTSEGPPNYVILRITNASAKQVKNFTRPWTTNFQHSASTNPDLSKQVTVNISPKIISVFGTIRGLKLRMKTYLENKWGATVVSYNSTKAVFDVPASTDLAALKSDLLDKFEEQIGARFLFSEADVDIALALGGSIELTRGQAQARLIDRAV